MSLDNAYHIFISKAIYVIVTNINYHLKLSPERHIYDNCQCNLERIRLIWPPDTYQTTKYRLLTSYQTQIWTGIQSSHLCPIFSLCFSRARSTDSGDVNWTNPSPAARPWPSFTITIPLGEIGSPVTTNRHHNPHSPVSQHTAMSHTHATN